MSINELLSKVNVFDLEIPYIKLNLEGLFKLQPVKPVISQTCFIMKLVSKGERK